MATKKFKVLYFLFGEEITRVLETEGIAAAVKAAKDGAIYATYYWDEYASPGELLSEYDGWNDWMQITKSQYEKLLSAK